MEIRLYLGPVSGSIDQQLPASCGTTAPVHAHGDDAPVPQPYMSAVPAARCSEAGGKQRTGRLEDTQAPSGFRAPVSLLIPQAS